MPGAGAPASAQGLGRLHRQLPAAVRSTPEGELLAGIAAAATDIDRGVELLESAAQRFADPDEGGEGGDLGLLSAVEHLAICAHWREDVALLERLLPYADQLTKIPEAQGLLGLGQALLADTAGDARGVLAALDAIDPGALGPYWLPQVAWLRATALLALGFPEAARRGVEVAVAEAGPSLRGGLTMLEVNALTHCGEHEAAVAALDRMLTQLAPAGNDHLWPSPTPWWWRAALSTEISTAPSSTWREPASTRAPARGHRSRPRCWRPRRRWRWPSATSAVPPPCSSPSSQTTSSPRVASPTGTFAASPCCTCWSPRHGNRSRSMELGPAYETGLALAQALVASREAGDLAPAAALTPEHWAAAVPSCQ